MMIDIIIDDTILIDSDEPLPDESEIRTVVKAACTEANFKHEPQLCIRLADDTTVKGLNYTWRHKNAVTDVLSFPMQEGAEINPEEALGDIILAVPFVIREAARLSLPASGHMLHLVIHGTLHLLGYDHIKDKDANIMHGLERSIMKKLCLHDPYPDEPYKEEVNG